jgi:hypothetical protein
MAPNLALAQRSQIEDMILSRCFSSSNIVEVVGCSPRSIRTIKSDLRYFGSARAPPNTPGWPRTITPPVLNALYDRLLEKPDIYQDEMVVFL